MRLSLDVLLCSKFDVAGHDFCLQTFSTFERLPKYEKLQFSDFRKNYQKYILLKYFHVFM